MSALLAPSKGSDVAAQYGHPNWAAIDSDERARWEAMATARNMRVTGSAWPPLKRNAS